MPERDLSRRLDMKSPDDVVCTLTRLRCVGEMNRTFWLVPGSFFAAIVTLPIRTTKERSNTSKGDCSVGVRYRSQRKPLAPETYLLIEIILSETEQRALRDEHRDL
jgi:hypothetical protein